MERKIKLGVIGAGDFSNYHLGGISRASNCVAIAVCDVNIERAKLQAEKYGIPQYYGSIDELLSNDEIEAVTIVTNDQSHKEATVKALRAGKHVLCEKPMALSLEECKEMIRVQRETGKILMVGQIGRYTPHFNKAVEMVENGDIGELFYVESEYAHDYSKIGGIGNWRKTPERHAVIGGGCHAVDLVRRIAGNPQEIFAYANRKILKDWPVDDCTVAVMKFPNDVIGKVMTSIGCKRQYTMRTVIYGSKGTLVVDSRKPYISLFLDNFTADTYVDEEDKQKVEIQIPVPMVDHNFAGEVTDFCDSIIKGKAVDCTGEEGMVTVAACLAIVESAATGEKIVPDYEI